MKLRKRIRNVLSSNRTFPAITCSIAILAVLITSCSKEEEKVPEKKVVRPVKIMTNKDQKRKLNIQDGTPLSHI
jgi:hypothetical protein